MDLDNLDWQEGVANVPGIKAVVYAAKKSEIATWPTMAADEVSYTGSFTMVENKTFKRIGIVVKKSPVTSEPQGEEFNETFLNKGTFVSALTGEAARKAATQATKDDLVYLIEEQGQSGSYGVIGHKDFRTITRAALALGDAPTSEKSTTFTVECTDPIMLPIYTGTIDTDDGVINEA